MNRKSFFAMLIGIILLTGCSSTPTKIQPSMYETESQSPETLSAETTEPIAIIESTTSASVNEYDLVDKFIGSLSESIGSEFSDITSLDIQGEDYRTEYRTFGFENAIGKRASIPGGSIEVVNYGSSKNESLRIYANLDSFELVSQLYENIVHLLDHSITDEDIKSQYNDSDLDINIFLGDAGNITGYINKDYQDGGLVGYDLMIDCKSPDTIDSNA